MCKTLLQISSNRWTVTIELVTGNFESLLSGLSCLPLPQIPLSSLVDMYVVQHKLVLNYYCILNSINIKTLVICILFCYIIP